MARSWPVRPTHQHQVGAGHGGLLGHAGAGVLDGGQVPGRVGPPGLAGHAGDRGLEDVDVLDLDRVEHDRQPPGRGHRLRQRLGLLGVAARQGRVRRQDHQQDAGTEQHPTDDVAGVVPAEQHAVQAHGEDDEPDGGVHETTDGGAPHQHQHQHAHDAAEGGDRRRVARREGVGLQQRLGALPVRTLAADPDLEPGGGERGERGDRQRDDGGTPVAAQQHDQRGGDGHDGHAGGTEGQLDPAQQVEEPRPRLDVRHVRAAATGVDVGERPPALGDRERQQGEGREAGETPAEQQGAGAVEHAPQHGRAATHNRGEEPTPAGIAFTT